MTLRRLLWAAALLALGIYLLTGLTQVRPGERAVVRRFGRVLDEKPSPGLWIGLPWGMERVDRVPVDQVRRVEVGYQPDADEDYLTTPPGQLLTGDHNLVNVQVVLNYAVRADAVEDYVVHAGAANQQFFHLGQQFRIRNEIFRRGNLTGLFNDAWINAQLVPDLAAARQRRRARSAGYRRRPWR